MNEQTAREERPPAAPAPGGVAVLAAAPAELHPRHLLGRAARVVALGALLAGLLVALPGLDAIRRPLAHAQPGWLSLAIAVELASAASYVVVLRAVFCPRMPWGLSSQLGFSELAANSLLPTGGAGGLALGAWSLDRGGMARGRIARRTVAFFLVTSAANFFVVIVAGVAVAAGVVPGRTDLALTVVPAAIATVAMVVVMVLPSVLPRALVVREAAPPGLRARVQGFVSWALVTVRGGILEMRTMLGARGRMAVAGSLGYLAFDVVTLAACLQATGTVPPLGDLALAYAIGQLGGVVPLPGGIGGTEAGLVGALVVYGAPVAPVTAAVLLYRLVQLGVPMLAGAPAFVLLRRTLRDPAAFATDCEAASAAELAAG